MSRIKTVFQSLDKSGRKALIPFVMAGDPDPQQTVEIMHALVRSGANIIELGMPFSDPMADGTTVQRAGERAILQGVSLKKVLEMVSIFRQEDTCTPIVLMGYANPIEKMGLESFAKSAKDAGIDGVLVVDYPPEEGGEYVNVMRRFSLDTIFLLAPTSTSERIAKVAQVASGYVYYVSIKGVTGAASIDVAAVADRLPEIRRMTQLPVGVGFGVRHAESAAALARVADAVVVGSRIIEEIEHPDQSSLIDRVSTLVTQLRQGMDGTVTLR